MFVDPTRRPKLHLRKGMLEALLDDADQVNHLHSSTGNTRSELHIMLLLPSQLRRCLRKPSISGRGSFFSVALSKFWQCVCSDPRTQAFCYTHSDQWRIVVSILRWSSACSGKLGYKAICSDVVGTDHGISCTCTSELLEIFRWTLYIFLTGSSKVLCKLNVFS